MGEFGGLRGGGLGFLGLSVEVRAGVVCIGSIGFLYRKAYAGLKGLDVLGFGDWGPVADFKAWRL